MRALATGAAVLALAAAGCSTGTSAAAPAPPAVVSQAVLEPGQDNPMIAQGVALGAGAAFYKTSGLGPKQMNAAAAEGTPESFIDTDQFAGGVLPTGVTITEAQGMNVLRNIRENLEAQGLTLENVTTMRVFLDNAPGSDRADYAGWNRAYRQFFANTNLASGDTELVPLGSAAPAAPLVRNPARPSRFALEVQSLPVTGWLVEVEVDAVFPVGSGPR
ncbi:Rid family hydrolase (plasmid) [Pseudonocardia alaniniphila]|uniref:Rid family hydrolase n=1 Tax=Pseudonocardia alaniniphila TaxID=75291 RepID=A0ABS9T7N6_9PSEU|nr:Rid family hydrolase [Pseudonocardia alaniniphila]MCH6164549.1 Rid family hydrolase [Pseudonocardia alaniniphila]